EPKHPYTRALLRSIPTMRAGRRREHLSAIRGMVPHPLNRPEGCPFHDRCDHAIPGTCDVSFPARADFAPEHLSYCHLYSPAGEPVHPGAATDDGTMITAGQDGEQALDAPTDATNGRRPHPGQAPSHPELVEGPPV